MNPIQRYGDIHKCCICMIKSIEESDTRLIDFIEPEKREVEKQKLMGKKLAVKMLKNNPDVISSTDIKRSTNAHKQLGLNRK